MPIPLLDESSLVISFSFFSILPEVGFSIPINIFNSVVFPHPEGPNIDKNYQNNTVVGVDQIYLGKELIYEEDIYITKNKNIAKESILSKIKKWFHD